MRITMIAFAVGIALVVISLGSQVVFAVADRPPKLNVGPSCDVVEPTAVGWDQNGDGPDHRSLLAV